jgi:Leucine-rich repeat (LRR) protein
MYEIEIFAQNFNDLSIFEGKHFPSLKLLKLEENNIRDISPLMTAKFDVLDVLNFARNKIDNRIIDNIKIFDKVFPVLGVLSLYHNYITDYDIFNEINNKIKGLRVLYIGSNNFDENTIGKINQNLYFKNLTLAGFTNGVVSDKTVDIFFTYVIIENLKKLYLDGNNLSSLSFIQKIKFLENVEILWLSNNNFNEYESISKYNFKKLDDFNISNNRINNIKNLEHFIGVQKNLTKMYLSGNKFDIFDNENKEILEKVNQNEKIQMFID